MLTTRSYLLTDGFPCHQLKGTLQLMNARLDLGVHGAHSHMISFMGYRRGRRTFEWQVVLDPRNVAFKPPSGYREFETIYR